MDAKLNGEVAYLCRSEGEILEDYITRIRNKDAALRVMKGAEAPWLPYITH